MNQLPPVAAVFLTHFEETKGQSVVYYRSYDEASTSRLRGLVKPATPIWSDGTDLLLQGCQVGRWSIVPYRQACTRSTTISLGSDTALYPPWRCSGIETM